MRAKIKSYNGKINTNFHNNKLPKEGSQFICLLVISIDSIFRIGKNYYRQLFLDQCKYVIKFLKKFKQKNSDEEDSSEEDSGKKHSD